jgi:nucleoside-diphosphate-sugar epimerase
VEFLKVNTEWELEKITPDNIVGYFDVLVNLAATTNPVQAMVDPAEALRNNGLIIYDLFGANFGRLIHVSTAEVYGALVRGMATITSPLNPDNPYAIAKAAQEHLIGFYAAQTGKLTTILNIMNVFGKYQPENKLFKVALKNIQDGEAMHGDPFMTRQFVHADEVANAIMALCTVYELEPKYHLAGGQELTIAQFVNKIADVVGKPYPMWKGFDELRPGHSGRYAMSSHLPINYVVRKTLDQYIEQTVNELT